MRRSIPPLYQHIKLYEHKVNFEMDSGVECTKLDVMVPSLAHVTQGTQAKGAMKSQLKEP